MDIKGQIQRKGFTISKVASLMTNKQGEKGITQSSLSQIINGNPSLDKLKEIASIIGMPLSELVADSDTGNTITITCPHCEKEFEIDVKAKTD